MDRIVGCNLSVDMGSTERQKKLSEHLFVCSILFSFDKL